MYGIAGIALLVASLAPPFPRDEFADVAKRLKSPEVPVRRQAAEDLAKFDVPETVGLLLGALDDAAPKVRDEAIRSLSRMKEPESLAVVVGGLDSPRPLVRLAVAEALGNARSAFDRAKLVRMAAAEKDDLARLAAIRALGKIAQPDDFDAVRKIEGKDSELAAERLRALAAMNPSRAKPLLVEALAPGDARAPAALRLLGEIDRDGGTAEAIRLLGDAAWRARAEAIRSLVRLRQASSIEPLIGALGKEAKPRLREDLARALRALTGMRFWTDAAEWDAWWKANRAMFEVAKRGADAGADPGRGGETTVTFFGVPVVSDAVVFAIDFSGSMREPAEPGSKETRKDRVVAELGRALRALPAGARFDVLLVRETPESWSRKGLEPATPKSIENALAFVERAVPQKSGDFWKGLRAAMENPDADTVHFLSDGAPSAGAFVYRERLVEALEALFRLRQVRVNTVLAGSDEHGERFLRELAAATGGEFRAAR